MEACVRACCPTEPGSGVQEVPGGAGGALLGLGCRIQPDGPRGAGCAQLGLGVQEVPSLGFAGTYRRCPAGSGGAGCAQPGVWVQEEPQPAGAPCLQLQPVHQGHPLAGDTRGQELAGGAAGMRQHPGLGHEIALSRGWGCQGDTSWVAAGPAVQDAGDAATSQLPAWCRPRAPASGRCPHGIALSSRGEASL